MSPKPESRIVKKTLDLLRKEVGGFWWKVHGGMFQRAGLPDICGVCQGLYIHLEAKHPDDKRKENKLQTHTINLIRKEYGLSFYYDDPEQAVKEVKKWVHRYGLSYTAFKRLPPVKL